jgi:hypothetical protein
MEAGMNYQETRDNEQLRFLDDSIAKFINEFSESRQTVIFFPGGLASRLLRAKTPYKANISTPQRFDFDDQEVWLSAWTFGHPELNALKLRMHKEADGFYHDEEDRIIIADGCIKFAGITPYGDFVHWCKDNEINLFIFGWDWRRPLDDTVKFFLNKFLPRLNQQLGNARPLTNFSLVGHSFGGMIVNLILRKDGHQLEGMNRAITVATPFYGYGGQIHRWFEGVSLLNHLGENKIDIIKTLGSLPASYTLNWLDEDTFNAIRGHLGSGDFGIQGYPSKDRADPYNPPEPDQNGRVRYPARLGFSLEELKLGRNVCGQLVMDLPDELATKFFNIRGVQIGLDCEALKQTICGTNWRLIEPDFDPRQQESPITDELGAGDEVLPAWSTHLVTLPEENRITVQGVLHHSFILSSDKVQKALGALLGLPSSTQTVNSVLEDDITNKAAALEADARKFVQELNDLFQNPKKKFPQAAARLKDDAQDFVERLGRFLQDPKSALQPDKILANALGVAAAARGFSDDRLRSIARRIIMDLCR